jgi:signal transduction histidine kinase
VRAQEEKVAISVAGNFGVVRCDKVRMHQVFANLVGNAFKHGRGTTGLAVEIGCDGKVYHVRDNGPGIPPEISDHMFEPFTQGEKTGSDSFGMGMNIVFKIVQKHGGEIWVESEPGTGTTIFFALAHLEDEDDEG